jgi:NAD(P)-dependent dehydrogenase (short-subunit alcohol dehydrogenase family)
MMSPPTAVVTGAARGIGAGVARRLAADGYGLFLVDLDPHVEELARQIADEGGVARVRQHDLRDISGAALVAEEAAVANGKIDVLVNSAGVSLPRRHDEVTEEEWDFIFDVNAKGTFFLTAAVARHMARQRSGSIVTISSISGKGWRDASSVAYAASKAAVIAMSRLLAVELGGCGVRVNAVCPGITRTEMMAQWSATRAAALGMPAEEFVTSRVQGSALGRPSEVADIAAMVSFLVSAEAGNVTGQSFNVDGGTLWD